MTTRLFRLLRLNRNYPTTNFHTSPKSLVFYEYDRKSGIPVKSDYEEEPKTVFERIREGYHQFKEESALFLEEIKENLRMDPIHLGRSGEVDVKWKFDGKQECLDNWIITCDSDHDDGTSTATLTLTPQGKGLFSGFINTQAIDDGRRKQTGYCNIKTIEPRKAFYRSDVHDWGMYSHLIMRVRGDGRNYFLNLHVKTTFDIMWNDLHHFVLYTRGGPYWQYVKIPFSKFFLSNRGRIQDTQGRVRTHHITAIGITAADGITGPFNLEIDYIGVENDDTFVEDFAYELYKPPNPYYV